MASIHSDSIHLRHYQLNNNDHVSFINVGIIRFSCYGAAGLQCWRLENHFSRQRWSARHLGQIRNLSWRIVSHRLPNSKRFTGRSTTRQIGSQFHSTLLQRHARHQRHVHTRRVLIRCKFISYIATFLYNFIHFQISTGTWELRQNCPRGESLSSFRLRVQPFDSASSDNTAVNSIQFNCTDGSLLNFNGNTAGNWGEFSADQCETGICGLETRVLPLGGTLTDNTALNDVDFICCWSYFNLTYIIIIIHKREKKKTPSHLWDICLPKYLGREIIIFYIFENVVIRFVIAIADVCSTSDDDNRISLVNFKQHSFCYIGQSTI